MAYCEVVDMPGGGTAIVRMGGKAPALCDVCKRLRHTKLCDAITLSGIGTQFRSAGTCNRKLCATCALTVGKQDFCPDHRDRA